MAEWYVKDLSRITKISVQTLHHYDRIGLLKPSVRLENGYRLYSEADLLTLQQIIALKFFGFELVKIKKLLDAGMGIVDHLEAQASFLQNQAEQLVEASHALNAIIKDCKQSKSFPWETTIQMIEVYRMKNELEHPWAKEVLNDEELKDYVEMEQDLKKRYTAQEKKSFEQSWQNLVKEIEANLDHDPVSDVGKDLAKRCMDMINPLYGKKFGKLKKTVWEKGFKGGEAGKGHGMSQEMVLWLDAALDAYYRGRIYALLNHVDQYSDAEMQKLWGELMFDMYGDEQSLKDTIIKAGLEDDRVNQTGKAWLKKMEK